MKRYVFFLTVIFAGVMMMQSCAKQDNEGLVDLSGTWQLKDFDPGSGVVEKAYLPDYKIEGSIPASIPGTVRQALLKAGKIPDPYYGYNNEKSLWVESREWWFFKDFRTNAALKNRKIILRFEGTVFKGDVWLNGKKIGILKGMFNPRSFDVTGFLKPGGNNRLAVRLQAPGDATRNPKTRDLSFEVNRDQLYSIAQCCYGWDWAPHMVPVGIWQPVVLKYSGTIRVDHPYVLSTVNPGKPAQLKIKYDVSNLDEKKTEKVQVGIIREKGKTNEVGSFLQKIELSGKESETLTTTLEIKDPKLWWPNGMGDHPLYVLELTAKTGERISDKVGTQFGIRELRMVDNEKVDESLKGMSQWRIGKVTKAYPWTFLINGKKMFAKGGNWIPINSLLRLDSDKYEHLLKLVREAHFNLLRVWGGGLYETDEFYNLCDEYGILTWQEFLSNRNFSHIDKNNFIEGAKATVYRIRNHPSLTFWCGGNEFNPDDTGSKAVIDTLAEVLGELDPSREFHRASPYMGDDHQWMVWHGLQPYTGYGVVRPFRSEAGINTFPVIENYRKFTPEKYWWPLDETYIEYHGERNPRFAHLTKLERYANEFGISSSLEEFVMKSQVYQALANEFNMEFCRANKFQNSGFLVWQFNDSWPTLSWSVVDWYGTPKPSYYTMKRASQPLAVSALYKTYLWKAGDTLSADVFVLNDDYRAFDTLTYHVALYEVNGRLLAEKTGLASVEANRSEKVGDLRWLIPEAFKGKTVLLSVWLKDKKGVRVSEEVYPLAVGKRPLKTLKEENVKNWQDLVNYYKKYYTGIFNEMNDLPATNLQADLRNQTIVMGEKEEGSVHMRLTNPTDHIAFFIRIRMKNDPDSVFAFYSDNYFSLLPGESKDVVVSVQNKSMKTRNLTSAFVLSGWNVEPEEIPVTLRKD